MRVKKLNSNKEILIKTRKYAIDWDNDGNSKLERQFKNLIRPFWERQIVLFQFTIPGSRLKFDFFNCNKKLAIEIQGEQHNEFNGFFMNNSRANYLSSIKRDMIKVKWCEQNGITLLEIFKEDLDNFSRDYIIKTFNIDIF